MHSTYEFSQTQELEPWREELIRELLSYDVQCPHSCVFDRNTLGQLTLTNQLSPLHWSRQFEWPWAIRAAELTKNHYCLDIGSGWSVFKFAIANRCQHLTCIDIDRNSLNKAQETIHKLGFNNIRLECGDVRSLPYLDNSFDRIFNLSVLEHFKEGHVQAIKECLRVLKPGGALLLSMDVKVEGEMENDFFMDSEKLKELESKVGLVIPLNDMALGASVNNQIGIVVYMAKIIKGIE